AERAQISPRAISDLERGQRTRPRRETMHLLANALTLEPADRAELEVAARQASVSAPPAVGTTTRLGGRPPRHNLPTPLTSFVGRERELDEVKRLLACTHLLTLTGTGG